MSVRRSCSGDFKDVRSLRSNCTKVRCRLIPYGTSLAGTSSPRIDSDQCAALNAISTSTER